MSEEWVAAELSGSAAVRSSMAGIDLVGARVLPALSSLAACTRPWWPRTTTTARQHSTHHHHRMWAEWWPTGARPDVAAGVLEGARVVADGDSVGCGPPGIWRSSRRRRPPQRLHRRERGGAGSDEERQRPGGDEMRDGGLAKPGHEKTYTHLVFIEPGKALKVVLLGLVSDYL